MHKAYVIKKIRRESPKAVSLIIGGKINFKAGQFIMLWVPGLDEKPFAVSYQDKNSFGVIIEQKGAFTKKIANLKPGTKIGIRGPYGNGFKIKNNSIVVAGGLGMAPSFPLIGHIKNSIIIQGAKSKDYLLYLKDKNLLSIVEKNKNKIVYCTDDGSFGVHGFTTDILKEMINKKIKAVYTCGPEIMMKKVFDICEKNNVECQASLERFMFCGMGVCGSCVCGKMLVCKDGPVFSSEQLREMKDFGKYAKLKSGKKVNLKEYYGWRSE
jgi:dihydroorotate dehydrogenase electron transfer subunit